jgi:hypothetical protein
LPQVVIVNGAQSGVAGYGNVRGQVGASNAANPALQPILYDPLAEQGTRFTSNFPSSTIERMYHSTASLTPNGGIIIMGSNPNAGVSDQTYMTRYEVEILSRESHFSPSHRFPAAQSTELVYHSTIYHAIKTYLHFTAYQHSLQSVFQSQSSCFSKDQSHHCRDYGSGLRDTCCSYESKISRIES